jgi:hypothetical protein
MSLLPSNVPFDLGSAVEVPTIQPYGLTWLLPVANLPFTLSALTPVEDVPYGSVGWEIVCRAHNDFQTEIFRTSEMAPPTFSKELSAAGMASVSFDLDHYLFTKLLRNGRPVEDLFDYENLWEIYFDKKLRFQFLGTASTETPVDASEVRAAVVSGNGIAQVLTWASVYPPNFPNIIRKLETLKDDFSGDRINTVIWNKTTTITGGVEISRQGQKEDILALIEKLTDEKENKTTEKANAVTTLAAETADYKEVYKDAGSTKSQKLAATKALNTAKVALARVTAELIAVTQRLTDAQLKNTLAPAIVDSDTATRAKLTVNSGEVSKTLSAGNFDFVSSGISARIEPLPQGVLQGQAKTTFGVQATATDYAWFYTANISGNRRLVAAVSDQSNVAADDFAFDPTTHAFWRIREDHATIIFDTSPDAEVWTEQFRVDNVSWVSTPVAVVFSALLQGNAGVLTPISAYISSINTTAIPAVDSVMATYREYLADAQARGTIPYVKTDFTDTVDSAGATWVGEPNLEVSEGGNLLQVLETLTELQQSDWIMDNDFTLKVFQKVWDSEEADPTLSFHKEDRIVMHEANAQLLRSRTRDRSAVGNSIVGKNAAGEYAYMEDEESISKFQRREMFIEAGNAVDLASLGTVLQASLAKVSDEKSSWRLIVDPNLPGKRVFDDYDVGDWIGVEMIDSTGTAAKNAWRIVGIAIQVDENAQITAELTLQSRMELLTERLQQQIANMGTSASNAGVTLGSSVSAATLIQQATLANLLDVSLPPTASRLEGDVLTWTGNYFTLQTPGDKTIPEAPVILSALTNVYYPADGVSVRAQAEVIWTLPTNTDGSTITDGHHFEVRYRPNTAADYSATWEEASFYVWDDLYTWAQPTIPPITNSGWQSLYVGWDDEQSTFIQELTPGVEYEIQVRAVDSSTPQHFSEWSDAVIFSAIMDNIAPATPAPPVVASSMSAIQVQHFLGVATGGQFNLPPDLAHLEVHVGGPAFFPDESTRVGKIVAEAGNIRSGTPVIQTFNIDHTENIWVRVVAVDRAGNRSSPSGAVTGIANLIDDAHISDLTASKITAGTISSAIILAGSIKTAESGARAEMNFEGFRIYSEDDDATVSLLGNPATNGNFLLIKDLEDPSVTLAGIDGLGRGSFQAVTVASDITIAGEDLIADIVNPRSKGVVAIGVYSGDPVVGGGQNIDRGFLEISFIAEESRTYMIYGVTEFESASGTNERMAMRLYDFGDQQPTLPATGIDRLQQSISSLVGSAGVNSAAQIVYAGTFTPGLHRILWTFAGQLGNCTVNALTGIAVPSVSLLWVEDVGIPLSDTVIINDGGVDALGVTATPDKPPAPKPKVEYTKTYNCTWSGTYRSNGDYSSSHGATMVQGDSGFDSWLNDARSLCGFDSAAIRRDLSGATVKACYVTLYANHWYWNDGGTARIGTHNYASRPSSWSGSRVDEQRLSSSDWPKPGKRKVSLGTGIGNDFKSGDAKGIALGPTSGSKTQYGRFNGDDQSNQPVLTIVYVK